MSARSLVCSKCNSTLGLPQGFSGPHCKCPKCSAVLDVPTAPAPSLSAPADLALSEHATVGYSDPNGDSRTDPAPLDADGSNHHASSNQAERFRLLSELGRGGMGAVVRRHDRELRREVAFKYLHDDTDPHKKARFIEEAQITGQLEHPNIVPVHDLGLDAQNRLFFSMKIVRGRSLGQILDLLRQGADADWPLSRLLSILTSVCHALAYAHSRNVVHRDLKPANIMVGDFGEVYVMDWGLAKVLGKGPGLDSSATGRTTAPTEISTARGDGNLTQDGSVLGTPVYMSPEQAQGKIHAIDARSDTYSLGAILYEILTLKPPIDREGGVMSIMLRVANGEIDPPEKRVPDRAAQGRIPTELAAIAMKALAKEPTDRYPSAEALRRDIELFQEGRSVSARQDTTWEAFKKLVRRNKGLSAGVACALAVLLVSSVVVGRSWLETRDAYSAYQQEQEDKNTAIRKAVPALMQAARVAANEMNYEVARAQTEIILAYEPENLDAVLLQGQLLLAEKQWDAAQEKLRTYLEARPDDTVARRILDLAAPSTQNDPAVLLELTEILQQQKLFGVAAPLMKDQRLIVEDRKRLVEIYKKQVAPIWKGSGYVLGVSANGEIYFVAGAGSGISDLTPLAGMQLNKVNLIDLPITSLEPLATMPLSDLNISGCNKLTSLKGVPVGQLRALHCGDLQSLNDLNALRAKLSNCYLHNFPKVTTIEPLKGLPLTDLHLGMIPIADLSPLRGMPLEKLVLFRVLCHDLTPLHGMKIQTLNLDSSELITSLEPLRGMPLQDLNVDSNNARISLAPLVEIRLRHIRVNSVYVQDLESLLRIPTLERVTTQGRIFTRDEFAKHLQAGGFKRN